jgi:hypothetical protein
MFMQQNLRFCSSSLALSSILLAGLQTSIAQTAGGTKSIASQPRAFLMDAKMLVHIKSAASSDSRKQEVVKAVTTTADNVMHEGPFSVMQKAIIDSKS